METYSCPPIAIPIVKPSIENTKVFKYSTSVKAAFDHHSKSSRTSKKVFTQNINAFGSSGGAPGGSRSPPRNF